MCRIKHWRFCIPCKVLYANTMTWKTFSGFQWHLKKRNTVHPLLGHQKIINLKTYTEIHHTFSHLQSIISCKLIHTCTVKNDYSLYFASFIMLKKILENFASTSIYIRHSRKGWNWKTMTWNRQRLWKYGNDMQSPHPIHSLQIPAPFFSLGIH